MSWAIKYWDGNKYVYEPAVPLHNIYGPATIWDDGYIQYCINNVFYDNFIEYIKAVIRYKQKRKIK